MPMSNSAEGHLISSKELLETTSISRATLNNYIKMGILPRPVVKKAEDRTRTRRMGYFPDSVVERIEMVRRLKRAGNSMEEIAKELKKMPDVGEPGLSGPGQETSPESSSPGDTNRVSAESLKLTIEDIHFPAYLVNHNFEIEWINCEAEDQIFNTAVRSITRLESRNIFKLFFSWEFHEHLNNWEEIIAFHMKAIDAELQRSRISGLYDGISEKEVSLLEKIYDKNISAENSAVNAQINLVSRDNHANYYEVHTIFFREGILFVYTPADREAHDIISFISSRERVINEILKRRMPSLVSLCVLVADLQDSVKLSAELLPEEYFEMINELWRALADSFEKYNGIHGKHAGDGILYYFIKKPGANYILDAIHFALDIREKVKVFSNEWKSRKGWLNDIYLNIGINEGQEFFGTIRSALNIEFTALGDSVNYAGRLSDFARYGSIWTTKNLIGKLDSQDLETFSFGTHRPDQGRDIFIKNSFIRVIDIIDSTDKKYDKLADISTLPVTEIISRK